MRIIVMSDIFAVDYATSDINILCKIYLLVICQVVFNKIDNMQVSV